jgi:hypothetical protein
MVHENPVSVQDVELAVQFRPRCIDLAAGAKLCVFTSGTFIVNVVTLIKV